MSSQRSHEISQASHNSVLELAHLKEIALLCSLGIEDDVESEENSSEDESGSESVLESCSDGEVANNEFEVEVRALCEKNEQQTYNSGCTGVNQEFPSQSTRNVSCRSNQEPSVETLLSCLRSNEFNWFSFLQEIEKYFKHHTSEFREKMMSDFSEYLPDSDVSESEKKLVEVSKQTFLDFKSKQPLLIEDVEIW